MVVAGRNVGYQRAERIERRVVALLYLTLHILRNLIHRHMARTFDKRLNILCPSTLHKLSHRVELGKLGAVVGIIDTARTKAVAKRNGYVIFSQNVAYIIKMLIEETLFLMHLAPL